MSNKHTPADIIRSVMDPDLVKPLSKAEWSAMSSSMEQAQRCINGLMDIARRTILANLGIAPRPEPAPPLAKQVVDAACAAVGALYESVTPEEVLSPSRRAHAVIARNIAAIILRERFGMTTVAIGRIIGRNHSSVVLAIQRAKFLISNEKRYGAAYQHALRLIDAC